MNNSIILERKAFLGALKTGGASASANATMPILENVRITSDGENGVKITSNNLQTEVVCFCKAEQMPVDEFDFCVNAKDITNVCSALNDYNVRLVIEENALNVCYAAGSMKLPIVNADEFPCLKTDSEPVAVFEIENQSLKNILESAAPFTGNDELRPNMMGVYIHIGENVLEYAATDAHVMINDKATISSQNYDIEAIIPKESIASITSALQYEGCNVVKIYDCKIAIETNGCTVVSVLKEGKYPNFRPIIPNNNSVVYRVRRDSIINAVKRMTMMASTTTQQVVIDLSQGCCHVSADDFDYGKSGMEKVEAECKAGENIRIGFNGKFLLSCLSKTESEYVNLLMNAPDRAALIQDENKPEKVILLMPVMLNC